MQSHMRGLEGFETNLGVASGLDFAPAVDARLALGCFAALQRAPKFARILDGGLLGDPGPSQCFNCITEHQLVPVVAE